MTHLHYWGVNNDMAITGRPYIIVFTAIIYYNPLLLTIPERML